MNDELSSKANSHPDEPGSPDSDAMLSKYDFSQAKGPVRSKYYGRFDTGRRVRVAQDGTGQIANTQDALKIVPELTAEVEGLRRLEQAVREAKEAGQWLPVGVLAALANVERRQDAS
ncbi:hypothetical protein [Gloeobacter violaceus]|uniref:hypothetical protein n=1 Tax=Gloeobacter violaceus TaxID=33072 RepID=UPI0013E8B258|nr:hypothetical protein [Gloeobacter violaceus]